MAQWVVPARSKVPTTALLPDDRCRYHNVARRYFQEKGFKHVALLSADGALEAAPAMGSADIILDLVRAAGVRVGCQGSTSIGWSRDAVLGLVQPKKTLCCLFGVCVAGRGLATNCPAPLMADADVAAPGRPPCPRCPRV